MSSKIPGVKFMQVKTTTGLDSELNLSDVMEKLNEAYQKDNRMRLSEAKAMLKATQAELARKDKSNATGNEIKLNSFGLSLSDAREILRKSQKAINEPKPNLSNEQLKQLELEAAKRETDRQLRKNRGYQV